MQSTDLGEEARLQPKWAETIDNLIFPAAYQKRLEGGTAFSYQGFGSLGVYQNIREVGIAAEKIDILLLGCDIEHVHIWNLMYQTFRKGLYGYFMLEHLRSARTSYLLEYGRPKQQG